MTRKRYIKLLMGLHGYTRNEAEIRALVDRACFGSYATAYLLQFDADFYSWFHKAMTDSIGKTLLYGGFVEMTEMPHALDKLCF